MIEVNNQTPYPADEDFLKNIINTVLKKEGVKKFDLSLALVKEGEMKELNRIYRGRDYVTDVLSFPFKAEEPFSREEDGEIIICPAQVEKNAERAGVSFKKEMSRVLIHSILHLLGYEHEKSEGEKREMREKEDYYLGKFSFPKNLIKK
ncbi:MAG: rRNA maturation RNase YbeY [Candidatus Nealsonbacteria bacterium]|nr:rRNA maturation RNase YbeY [Candidatus Nealsonbacteria bacterium]